MWRHLRNSPTGPIITPAGDSPSGTGDAGKGNAAMSQEEIRLSYSAITLYERCPFAYRLEYVDGLKPEPSPYLSFGRTLHAVLQWMYDRDVPEPPSLEEVLSRLEECWEEEGYAGEEEEGSFRRHAREVLTAFYRRNHRDFNLPVALEHRFEVKMDGYVLTGVIDRIDRHPDGRYEVIDYKTNRRLPPLERLRDDLQLPIYQMACMETWGIRPSKLSFYFLLPNQKFSTRPYDEAGLDQVRERLSAAAEGIREGIFPPRRNRLCAWCSHRGLCPEGEEGRSEEEMLILRRRALLQRKKTLEARLREVEEELAARGFTIDGDDIGESPLDDSSVDEGGIP